MALEFTTKVRLTFKNDDDHAIHPEALPDALRQIAAFIESGTEDSPTPTESAILSPEGHLVGFWDVQGRP